MLSEYITVFELKKDRIGISAFLQAVGYIKGLTLFLERRGLICDFSIALIGSEIDTSGNFIFIPDCFGSIYEFNPMNKISSVDFYTYKYDFDGISFDHHSYYYL